MRILAAALLLVPAFARADDELPRARIPDVPQMLDADCALATKHQRPCFLIMGLDDPRFVSWFVTWREFVQSGFVITCALPAQSLMRVRLDFTAEILATAEELPPQLGYRAPVLPRCAPFSPHWQWCPH